MPNTYQELVDIKPNDTICNICATERHLLPSIIQKIAKCKACNKKAICSICVPAPQQEFPPLRRRSERKRCPHCENEIDGLQYRMYGYEYGSADLDGDICDTDGFEGDGEFTLECPECNADISTSDLIDIDEDEEGGETT
jgi:hypothetical protein